MDTPPERPAIPPETARDTGLRRAATLTKWIGVGAVALVGTLAGFVAQAKPGKSTGTSQSSAGRTPATSVRTSSPATGSPSVGGTSASPTLSPPAAPPAPSLTPPVASSGGS